MRLCACTEPVQHVLNAIDTCGHLFFIHICRSVCQNAVSLIEEMQQKCKGGTGIFCGTLDTMQVFTATGIPHLPSDIKVGISWIFLYFKLFHFAPGKFNYLLFDNNNITDSQPSVEDAGISDNF